ncbi:Catenin alpha-1 [Varanus komodoensis]|nr:Catenin alpha-1 [Varanus komodoensis]
MQLQSRGLPTPGLNKLAPFFLFHVESHILEDVNRCIIALREQDADDLDRAAGAIRGRAARVAHIVSGEMDNYEIGTYTEGVMRSVRHLTNTGMEKSLLLLFAIKLSLIYSDPMNECHPK